MPRPGALAPSAWELQPEAQRAWRPPLVDGYEPTLEDLTASALRHESARRRRRRLALEQSALRGEAYSEPRNQIAEAGMGAMEMTGAPSFARGIQAVQESRPGDAIPEFTMGALSLAGMMPVAAGPRAVFRRTAPELPAPRMPVNPTRELGYASDGSILPVRPPEPFRNSMRGGSDDLREAAQSAPRAPDAPDGSASGGGRSIEQNREVARSWVEQFGGGPEGEARAIRTLRQDLRRVASHDALRADHEAMIAAIEDGSYRQGARNSFSARVEAAFPELYSEAPNAGGGPKTGPRPKFQGRKR